jgi:ppGpp synthetase/RelA/SpoT-type nucleotidyltranferase
MTWTIFSYTKTQIRNAGKILKAHPKDQEALDILASFRSAHAYPLNSIQDNLRKQARKIAKNKDGIIISQRLKRMPSILSKIERESSMELTRMQDIWGCRAIFESTAEVYACQNALIKSRMQHNPPERTYDYIENPKNSWYRGIHLVYKFHSESSQFSQYNEMLIEIQLRTKLQHNWATAVETVGIFTGEALKSSQGDADWQDFFRLSSTWFAIKEWQKTIPDTPDNLDELRMRLREYMKNLNVEETLTGFSHAIREIDDISKREWYILLVLNPNEKRISWNVYAKDQIEMASEIYSALEQKNQEKQDQQIVLFSLESALSLKKAYPNYFGDTKDFMKNLLEIFD